jgi:hypothetical protein
VQHSGDSDLSNYELLYPGISVKSAKRLEIIRFIVLRGLTVHGASVSEMSLLLSSSHNRPQFYDLLMAHAK